MTTDIEIPFGNFKVELFALESDNSIGITVSRNVEHPVETVTTDIFVKFNPEKVISGDPVPLDVWDIKTF